MSVLPGWNSIETTNWISDLFFWLSIIALILLGVTEVISHYYGERHDTLLAEQYRKEKYGTDSEIARLHSGTAQANEEAKKAQEKAEAERLARVKLEATIAPRELTKAQAAAITAALTQFKGKALVVQSYMSDTEGHGFLFFLAPPLAKAGINIHLGFWYPDTSPEMAILSGCEVSAPPSESAFASALQNALFKAGVEMRPKWYPLPEGSPVTLHIGVKALTIPKNP